jgi:Fe-S cluster biogenesis protein NfuA
MSTATLGNVKIMADPKSMTTCRFTVDRPVHADSSYYFAGRDKAAGSALAERLFRIPEIATVLLAHDRVEVTKSGQEEWLPIAKQVGATIREHLASGEPAVSDALRAALPSEDEIRSRVIEVIETRINPAVAAHGGYVGLIDVKENTVYLQFGGGCQGCGQATATLKNGVEVEIRSAVPEVGEILDTTDHAAGRNPYFAPAGSH